MVEAERMLYVRNQQQDLRCETYSRLVAAAESSNQENKKRCKKVILPSSFTGSPRYMMQNYLDAMAMCKWYGYPDLFITFTCNPKWPEITRYLKKKGLKSEDRPDVTTRVFKMKLDTLIKDIKEKRIFGKVKAEVYTIEFQKRGLPHCHLCVWLETESKLRFPADIDRCISAEIPDKDADPELYQLVKEFMMHGPCGPEHRSCPCMVENKCSKKFPKQFNESTFIDESGYAIYKRSDNGRTIQKQGADLDNTFVVPYSPTLLKRYQAYINVEWCNQFASIKYLFKYINKGPDRVTAVMEDEEKDKINDFYDCRYLSACEAAWRIFKFDIHHRYPSVERLPFHLPNEHSVLFDLTESIDFQLEKESANTTKFLQWMETNKTNELARKLLYVEFPKHFVWNKSDLVWTRRKQGKSIGRIHHVPPNWGELFYLRMLLNHVRGATGWESFKRYDNVVYSTYKEACFARGLLDDDKEYIDGIIEASQWGMGDYLRSYFVKLILSNSMSRPEIVWEKSWRLLAEDVLDKERRKRNHPGLELSYDQRYNICLTYIEDSLLSNSKSLKNIVNMPYPNSELTMESYNRLIYDELDYNIPELVTQHQQLYASLTVKQKEIYETIIDACENNKGGMFFVYGYGGTGKTFLYKTLTASLRSKGEIVLNVASSGIAALLLDGGRTAHSRFAVPINIDEDSMCTITADSPLADLIRKTKLIIWDEAPMVHRHCFEAFDRSLRDIATGLHTNIFDKVFGGKVVVFGGDFRQILPVIPCGSRQDVVHASLNKSYLWDHCKVLKLTENMRLRVGCNPSYAETIKEFAYWILSICDGKIGGKNDGHAEIQFPEEMLIPNTHDHVEAIINETYENWQEHLWDPTYFQDRAILAPTHEEVEKINSSMMSKLHGTEKIYYSSDTVSDIDVDFNYNESLYSTEFLNSIKCSGIPNHKLTLKVGAPVMCMRNIDQRGGLCNGTRLQILRMGTTNIEAKVISGGKLGEVCAIPRMIISPSDKKMPFQLKRKQFPISVSFAMTINNSQGQTLAKVGLYLERPVFSHGQLYVAVSRVKSKKGLKVLCCDKDGNYTNTTTNVVYKEVLHRL